MIDDKQIIELILDKSNTERGFRLLMSQYQEKLYWHIRRMVDIHEDADDVLQNTLIKIYKNIEKFNGQSTLYTWIHRIATNEALNLLKKRKNKLSSSLDNEETAHLSQRLTSDPYFDENEATLQLAMGIASLPNKQKLVFNMRYHEEMSYKQISDILDTSVGSLKASYHHAVNKLENYLKTKTI